MATIYFGKINISSNIFEVYNKGDGFKRELLEEIHKIVSNTEHEMLKEYKFIDPETEQEYINSITYELKKQYADESIIVADFIKGIPVNVRQKDVDGRLQSVAVPNYEPIRFYMDTKKEIIAYYTTTRFGYKQFLNDFEYFINESIQKSNNNYFGKIKSDKFQRYIVLTSITENTDLNDFYEKLLNKGKIQEIQFNIIPPNASEEYLDSLSLNAKKRIELMEEAGITEEMNVVRSSTPQGINLKARSIKILFKDMNSINEKIEEINNVKKNKTNLGYVEGKAENSRGEFISTKDEAIYKRKLKTENKNVNAFKEHCQVFIDQILKDII